MATTREEIDGAVSAYGRYIAQAARDVGLPIEPIAAMIFTESSGRPSAVSNKGAQGLMQLMPETAVEVANELGYTDFTDAADLAKQLIARPGLNILFGAKYYKNKLDEFRGDHSLAAAAYNAGAARVRQAGRRVPQNDETPGHNRRFLDAMTALGWDGKTFPSTRQVAPPAPPAVAPAPVAKKRDPWWREALSSIGNDLRTAALMSDFDPVVGGSPVFRGDTPERMAERSRSSLPDDYRLSPAGQILAQGFLDPRGDTPVPAEKVEPQTGYQRLAGAVGRGGRIGLEFAPIATGVGGAMSGVNLIPQASKYAAPLAQAAVRNMATGAGTFAAHSALTGGSPVEQAEAAAQGVAFSAIPMVPGISRVAASGPVGAHAVGAGAMVGVEAAAGKSLQDALIEGIGAYAGMAAGGAAGHSTGGQRRSRGKKQQEAAPTEVRPEWVGEAAVPEVIPDAAPPAAREIAAQVAPQAPAAQARRVPYQYVPPPAEMIRAPVDGPSGPPVREMPEKPARRAAAEEFVGEGTILNEPLVGPQATPPAPDLGTTTVAGRRQPYRAPKPIGAGRENLPVMPPDVYVGEGTIFGNEAPAALAAKQAKASKGVPSQEPLAEGHPYREFEADYPIFKPGLDYLEGKIGWSEYARDVATNPQYRELPAKVAESIKAGETKNVSRIPYWVGVRPASVIQGIGGGNPKGSPVERVLVQFNEVTDQAMRKAAGDVAMEADAIVARHGLSKGDEALLVRVMREEDGGIRSGESGMEYRRRNPEFFTKAEKPDAVVDAAVEMRALSDKVWLAEKQIAEAYGKDVGYQSAYWPSVSRKPSALKEPLKRFMYDIQPTKDFGGSRRPMKNTPVNVARELKKEGAVKDPDLGFDRGRGEMAVGFSRRMATTPLAKMYDEVARTLEANGQPQSAEVIRAIGNSTINDIGYGIRSFTQSAFETTPVGMALFTNPSRAAKRVFNRAKYALNFAFLLMTGPQSISENAKFGKAGKYDPLGAGRMARAIWDGTFSRDLIREYRDSWVGQTKSGKWLGGMHEEVGSGTSISAEALRRRGKFEIAKDKILNEGGRFGEEFVGRVTFAWGQQVAKDLGMTRGERAAFLNQLVAKTQGLYSGTMRGETQKDAFVNAWFPAQTHSINAIQNQIEIWNNDFGWNLAGSRKEKAEMFGRGMLWTFVFGILANAIRNAAVDKAEDMLTPKFAGDVALDVGSAQIPYASPAVLGPMGSGASKGIAMPVDTALQVRDGIKAAIDGDVQKSMEALSKALVNVQLARVIGTERRIDRGDISDTAENRLRGYLFGWSTTDEGKAYVRQMRGMEEPTGPGVAKPEELLSEDQKRAIERAKGRVKRRR